jgi:hypothetical protein
MDKKKSKKPKADKNTAGILNSNLLYTRDKDSNSISGNYNYVIDTHFKEKPPS